LDSKEEATALLSFCNEFKNGYFSGDFTIYEINFKEEN
jgi:hypothetical protein